MTIIDTPNIIGPTNWKYVKDNFRVIEGGNKKAEAYA